jgi:thermostable 8-oxoguanine DNA glycosylase
MVVLGIADPDGVVSRKAERPERSPQPCGFADRLGKNHQAAPIEQQHEWEFEFSNDSQDRLSERSVCFYDALAARKSDSAALQLCTENLGQGLTEQPREPIAEAENGTVFRYHSVDTTEIANRMLQI